MAGKIEFEILVGRKTASAARQPAETFRILVLGDFSGRRNRGRDDHADLARRPLARVDVDRFERVFSDLAPGLQLPDGQTVVFSSLEDFHPDALYRCLSCFRELRDLRRRLNNPAGFDQAADEVRRLIGAPAPTSPSAPSESDADAITRLLGRAPTPPPPSSLSPGLEAMMRRIVAPHLTASNETARDSLQDSLDQISAQLMRGILHHPDFQALEAGWRGVYGFVQQFELEEMTLHLLDVSTNELAADLVACGGEVERSGLYRRLLGDAAGGPGWAVIAGMYRFGGAEGDLALLAGLGSIAAAIGAPFIAAADPALVGASLTSDPRDWHPAPEITAMWKALRQSRVARHIGLALPRLLARLPYGAGCDEVESFRFEEFDGEPEHEALLWGNPALACVGLLAEAWQESGWEMEQGDALDIEDLPAYTYKVDGESRMVPAAEVLLGERQGHALLDQGLMPIASYRNRDAARLLRFQSIASPTAALAGPWD